MIGSGGGGGVKEIQGHLMGGAIKVIPSYFPKYLPHPPYVNIIIMFPNPCECAYFHCFIPVYTLPYPQRAVYVQLGVHMEVNQEGEMFTQHAANQNKLRKKLQ